MKRWQPFFLFLLLPVYLFGQEFDENNFVRYTTADGLSHNVASGIVQDSTGYVWISTFLGLNRYNGSRFVQFHSNSDSLSIASEEINGMAWLDKYRIAVFNVGLHIVDTRTGKTRNLFIPYKDKQYQYKFNMISMVKGDEAGNIYVLSRSGFYHFDKNYKLVSRFDYYSEQEVYTEHFFFGSQLFWLDDQRLIMVTQGGLYIYDIKKKQVKKMEPADCPILAEFLDYPGVQYIPYRFFQPRPGSFFVVQMSSNGIIYIDVKANKKVISRTSIDPLKNEFHYNSKLTCVSDTLFYITGQTSGFFKLRFYPETGELNLYPKKYFPSYACNSLLLDNEENLWIATTKGVLRQDPGRTQVEVAVLPSFIRDSFPNIRIDDIYITRDKVYAGTRGYGGLCVFDKKTLRFNKQLLFKHTNPYANNYYAITDVDSSTLMLGTGGPLYLFNTVNNTQKQLFPPKWTDGDWVNDLYRDKKGNIWIGAFNIYKYNPFAHSFTHIPTHQRLLAVPFVIEEDNEGHIWMAGHGLARYNINTNTFDKVVDSFPSIKMLDKQINALVVDNENTLWFNSNNNGLIAYNIDRKTFRHFTRSDGLPDDNIASMIIIGKRLWLACYSGIACLDLRTFQIISFGKEDGFPDMPITKGARFFYDSVAQNLYLGFTHAVVRFKPYDILRRKSPPHVFIENLAINGNTNEYLPKERISTSWRDNELMITIGSINFSDSYSQRFAYRILKNGNTTWQQLGSSPSFSISNLSPGDYTIQVKAFSLNNRWPEQVEEIHIVVTPPFWKKNWFIFLCAGLLTLMVYLLVKWRTNVARKKEMEKTHIQKLKADDYKNQFELEQISNYFSSSLADKKSEEDVLWDVTNNLISRMNYVDCMIYLWNEDKTKMIQKAAYGPKGKPEFISSSVFDVVPGQGVVGHVIKTMHPVLITDTRKDGRYRVDEEFRLSEVCVPIIHNDELMGIIDSEHYLPGYFSERDIKILTTIATLIGNKLKQIESERSLEANREELASINEQLAEAQLSALQAQMNPHFVFNALNSIKRMILDGDNETASRYLSKFALMIRMTLNHSKAVFVTLDESTEYLKAYLEMEQLRFDSSFTYKIFVDENIETQEATIPSLMIQPLVENAIWHGLMHVEGEKKIRIGFSQEQNRITCTIEDNGIGIRQSGKLKETNHSPHKSVGLENIGKRIKIMNEKYETNCTLKITDLKDTDKSKRGTLVILGFNVINS